MPRACIWREHEAEAVVDRRGLRAPILRQRQSASIDEERVVLVPHPDHAGEHGHGDLVRTVREYLRLEQVTEHVDACADLRDPIQTPRMQRGWRAAHRHDADLM